MRHSCVIIQIKVRSRLYSWHFQLLLDLFHLAHHFLERRPKSWVAFSAAHKDIEESFVGMMRDGDVVVLVVADHADDLRSRVVFVGNAASQHLPQQYAETVDVGGAFVLASAQYLRSHPVRRSYSDVLVFLLVLGGDAGKAEVAELDVPVLVDEQV